MEAKAKAEKWLLSVGGGNWLANPYITDRGKFYLRNEWDKEERTYIAGYEEAMSIAQEYITELLALRERVLEMEEVIKEYEETLN